MKHAIFDGWPKRDGTLEVFYPRNAGAAARNTSGLGAWVWTAYADIAAGIASDFVPTCVHMTIRVNPNVLGISSMIIEHEVAIGAGGAEVTFHQWADSFAFSLTGTGPAAVLSIGRTIPIGPQLIPAGSTIRHRVRASVAAATAYVNMHIYLGGYDGGRAPAHYSAYNLRAHLAGVEGGQSRDVPSGAPVLVDGDAFPLYGAWVQVIDPAPADLLVWGAVRLQETITFGAIHLYLDVGTGALGFEQTRGILAFPSPGFGQCGYQCFVHRPVFVKKGERVAIRITGSGIGNPQYFLLYWEQV